MHAPQLRTLIIRPALKIMGMWSQAAENLLMGTAAQESRLGYYLKQVNGPACGLFQMEPATAINLVHRFFDVRRDLELKTEAVIGVLNPVDINWDQVTAEQLADKLIYDSRFATALARVRYAMVPTALPAADDVPALGRYWKEHWNTRLGDGTAEQFCTNYRKLVLSVSPDIGI